MWAAEYDIRSWPDECIAEQIEFLQAEQELRRNECELEVRPSHAPISVDLSVDMYLSSDSSSSSSSSRRLLLTSCCMPNMYMYRYCTNTPRKPGKRKTRQTPDPKQAQSAERIQALQDQLRGQWELNLC